MFPRILVIHDYRPEARSLADLLRQLYKGYPPEYIHWWYCRETPLHEEPDLRAGKLHSYVMPERLVPHVRQTAIKGWLLENVWAPRAARHLEAVIAQEKPDLVVALLFGWSVPVLARVRWPAGQRRHFSLWDFPDSNGMRRALGAARSQRFLEAVHQLVGQGESFDAICTGALEELKSQTGRLDGLVVHSGFEPHHLRALEATATDRPDETLRIAYVGTIISEQGFLNVLEALKTIRPTLSRKLVLEFFGGRNYRSRPWFEPDWMHEHGLFTDEGLVAALRRCDWGIVVMDPEGQDMRYSRFSFPNKVGTYLSAGVPVLGFGHAQSSLAQILREHGLGCFTDATQRGALEQFLSENLQLPSPREVFREAILQCARTEFNAAEIRARLWRVWGAK